MMTADPDKRVFLCVHPYLALPLGFDVTMGMEGSFGGRGRAAILKSLLAGILLAGSTVAQPIQLYPLEKVRPGQKGYGKTVFHGNEVEKFDVEILGVLEKFEPRRNLILVRVSGSQLDRTGVFAGMSGSPVYIEEKLVGAIAYSFPFAKEPIAGVTPIQETLDVFKEIHRLRAPPAPERPRPDILLESAQLKLPDYLPPFAPLGFEAQLPGLASVSPFRLTRIATPVNTSGFSAPAVEYFRETFRRLGLVPVQGAGGAETSHFSQAPLEPGSSISVELARGDVSLSASGTVTHISGNKIYAFGHPFLNLGYTDMPMNQAAVLTIIPQLNTSHKVAAATRMVGAVKQDRATGIMGMSGSEARLIPVHLKVRTSRNEDREYAFETIRDSFLTPFVLTFSVYSSLISSEKALGDQTLRIKSTVSIAEHPEVVFENNIARPSNNPVAAAVAAAAPAHLLLNSGFEQLEVEHVGIEIEAVEQIWEATLEKVWQDKLEARPGEEVNLTVFLRKFNGETMVEKFPVKIPEDILPGPLKIMIGDGLSLAKSDAESNQGRFIPENVRQLVRAINNLKKNDRLYVRLFRDRPSTVVDGERLSDLPPSFLALYTSRKTSGDVRAVDRAVYVEHELPATEYVIQGQRVIQVEVKS